MKQNEPNEQTKQNMNLNRELELAKHRLESMHEGRKKIESRIMAGSYEAEDLETARKTLKMLNEQIEKAENHVIGATENFNQASMKLKHLVDQMLEKGISWSEIQNRVGLSRGQILYRIERHKPADCQIRSV